MKRKNKLKQSINNCFICGKPIKKLKDKLGHRINPKKGNNKHNLIIVCESCKKVLQKVALAFIRPSKEILNKYFKLLSIEDRKIILNKLYNLRNNEIKQMYRGLE